MSVSNMATPIVNENKSELELNESLTTKELANIWFFPRI